MVHVLRPLILNYNKWLDKPFYPLLKNKFDRSNKNVDIIVFITWNLVLFI